MADEILRETGYDLARFPTFGTKFLDPRTKVFDIAVRAKRLDEVVRRFVTRHPDAVVLDLRAGLDGKMLRVNPPPTVDWYDIDFPEILVVRRQVLPQRTDAHDVGSKPNRRAQALMRCQSRIVVIPGATRLLEEPGTLERAAADACAWFTDHLVPTPRPMA